MKKVVFILSLILFDSAYSQLITGRVSGNEPIEFAHVYLSNTEYGTYSDLDGEFRLENVTPGEYQLVVSHVGYKLYSKRLTLAPGDTIRTRVDLTTDESKLDEVQVSGRRDGKWERQLNIFKRRLFGGNDFSGQCEIENPWVMDFDTYEGVLYGKASGPLQIVNNALGYRVRYDLQEFHSASSRGFSYRGFASYTELDTINDEVYEKWTANRYKAYSGSMRHFFSSLMQNKLEENGFLAYLIKGNTDKPSEKAPSPEDKVQSANELISTNKDGLMELNFRGTLKIIYFGSESGATTETLIKLNRRTVINGDGSISIPTNLVITGDLATKGFPYFLPFGFISKNRSQANKDFERLLYKYNSIHPNANKADIHLHLDKNFALPGDTIRFAGYVNLKELIDSRFFQGTLEVTLSDSAGVHQQILIKVKDGHCDGYLPINKNFPFGNYHLTAKTTNKTIEGPAFSTPVNIGKVKPIGKERSGVRFKPEGGQLVRNMKARIAYRIPKNQTRFTLLENGKVADSIEVEKSEGWFEFTPANGSYQVEINGVLYELGEVQKTGIALRIEPAEDHFNLTTSCTSEGITYYILFHAKGKTLYQTKLNNDAEHLSIPYRQLSQGIVTSTVFDENLTPQFERFVYVPISESAPLSIETDRFNYGRRSKVKLSLHSNEAINGSLSVVCLSATSSPSTSIVTTHHLNGITDQSLLSHDRLLNGSMESLQKMDWFLSLNGVKDYEWERIKTTEQSNTVHLKEGLTISGTVFNGKKATLKKGMISVSGIRNDKMFTTATEIQKGVFRFDHLKYSDTSQLFLQSFDRNGLLTGKIIIDTLHDFTLSEPSYLEDAGNQQLFNPGRIIRLRQQRDSVYHRYFGERGEKKSENKTEQAENVRIKSYYERFAIYFHRDDFPEPPDSRWTGNYEKLKKYPGNLITSFGGYQPADSLTLFNPNVSYPEIPDLRSTLLWIPNVEISNGEELLFEFYTNDLPGPFAVVFEGLNRSGDPIRVYKEFMAE
ncbi:MAG: carboxypeptidase-like regulatory domain-containing protein [Cyclobacteriaceae bacterium]